MIKKITFVGAGNMGEALIRGILNAGLCSPASIMASDVRGDRLAFLRDTYNIKTSPDKGEALQGSEIIILAVKPQSIEEVAGEINPFLTGEEVLISIAAGVDLKRLRAIINSGRIIRVMPNTPALVLKGVTCICKDDVEEADLVLAQEIFNAVGRVIMVKEALIDAVTGLSGSGPAYCFIFLEALADGGVKMGLPRQVALELATQTMLGAAALVSEFGKHPGELKDMVASPGGTTIYGLHELERGGIRGTIMDAVEEATLRSQELGEER